MRLVAFMGASGTIIWLSLAAAVVLFSLFAPVDVQSPKDHIINDINNLGANAYQYRIHPLSDGGGGGTYLGYQIPRTIYVPTQRFYYVDTTGGFSYRVIYVYSDSIIFEGRYQNHHNGAIQVNIDSEGKLTNWRYFGGIDN
jgi:hypothetical protein